MIAHHRFALTRPLLSATIGNRMNAATFKRLRKQMGLTKADLARELKVSRAAVSRWESGKRGIGSVLALAMDCLAERKRRGHGRKNK